MGGKKCDRKLLKETMLGSKRMSGNQLGLKRGAKIDLIGAKVRDHKPMKPASEPAEKKDLEKGN